MAQDTDISLPAAALPISKCLTAAQSLLSLPGQHVCVHSNIPGCVITPRSGRSQAISHGTLQLCRDFTSRFFRKNRSGAFLPKSWDDQTCPCFIPSFKWAQKLLQTEWKLQSQRGKASHPCPSISDWSGTPHWATSRQPDLEPQTANRSEPCVVWKETTHVTITAVWKGFCVEQHLWPGWYFHSMTPLSIPSLRSIRTLHVHSPRHFLSFRVLKF